MPAKDQSYVPLVTPTELRLNVEPIQIGPVLLAVTVHPQSGFVEGKTITVAVAVPVPVAPLGAGAETFTVYVVVVVGETVIVGVVAPFDQVNDVAPGLFAVRVAVWPGQIVTLLTVTG